VAGSGGAEALFRVTNSWAAPPNCQALYHVVKVEAGPETTEAELTCRACGAPFPGREGKIVLKYFMLRHGARGRRRGPAKTGERPEETI
jgi:hypothetical protein